MSSEPAETEPPRPTGGAVGDAGFGTWTDEPPAIHVTEDPPERDVWHRLGDGGRFGSWTDEPPAFHVAADPPERDVWHQVGNDRLTATAHLDGYVTVYSTDAGTIRLSSPRPDDRAEQGGTWAWLDRDGRQITSTGDVAIRATWEIGAATWTVAGDGWSLTRRVWVPFGQDRVVRVDVDVVARDLRRRGGSLVERWGFWPVPIVVGGLMAPMTPAPPGYRGTQRLGWLAAFAAAQVSRTAITGTRQLLGRSLQLRVAPGTDPGRGIAVLSPRRGRGCGGWLRPPRMGTPSRLAWIEGQVVVAALDATRTVASVRSVPAPSMLGADGTAALLRTDLPDAERVTLSYAVGLVAAGTDPDAWLHRQCAIRPADSRAAWRETFGLRVSEGPDLPLGPALGREMTWHAGMLRSAQVAEPVFGSSYVAQGSAYGFVNGLQGAARDYAHFMTPLCLVDPAGARSLLFTMLALQHRDGTLAYAHTGSGWRTSALIHAEPTDLQLSLLWAAVEYVAMTGDVGVLAERAPWQPAGTVADLRRPRSPALVAFPELVEGPINVAHWRAAAAPTRLAGGTQDLPGVSADGHDGEAPTVAQRLLLAWRHLRDGIGLGPHGLVRIGSGDWSDPISSMVPSRRALRRNGESGYNSAMAASVLPRAAELLHEIAPESASAMRQYAVHLRAALQESWTGRWFLRGWDGRGGPIGADRLFLDNNAWCLIADIGTEAQRRTLVTEIAMRLDDPSPIGALSLDRPIAVRGGILAPGWDTNGGIWPALNALLAWGYARHDPPRAVRLLERMTFATHARTYPDVWAGIWSGPDAFNAHHAQEPGGTYVQPATPMAEFPVMNANAHAGPLLALVKVLGLDPAEDGPAGRHPSGVLDRCLSTARGEFRTR